MPGTEGAFAMRWVGPALAATVVAFTAGSSSIPGVVEVGRTLRWVALFLLLGVAALAAAERMRAADTSFGVLRFAALPGAFLAFAVLSTTWSVDRFLTFARAGTLGTLFVLAGLLGFAVHGRARETERLLAGIVLAALAVAVAGFVLLALGSDHATQQAGNATPWRLRGFAQNPNTAPMLYSLALPISLWLVLRSPTEAMRRLGGTSTLVLTVALVASQSRGAYLASFVGLLVVVLALVPGIVRKSGAVVVLVAAFVAANATREITQPEFEAQAPRAVLPPVQSVQPVQPRNPSTEQPPRGAEPETPTESAPGETTTSEAAAQVSRTFPRFRGPASVRPEDEIGHPLFSATGSTTASGRLAAWRGAVELIEYRPLLGYGFGTESEVFVDRWYYFQGGNPENAYLGILLQLGGLGLGLFLLLGVGLLVLGVRVARPPDQPLNGAGVACLGVVAAGAALMLVQSYVYSVGNIATVSFWVAALVLAGTALARGPERLLGPESQSARPPVAEIAHVS